MRFALAIAGLMLLQVGHLQGQEFGAGPRAEPQHLRYERRIVLPPAFAGGVACAVLDATALAHAASRSGDDLRVFDDSDGRQMDVPFALTESEAAPGDAEPARVENLALRDGGISFDLVMPHRPYTEVDLRLGAKNFVGTAEVWGMHAARSAIDDLDRTGNALGRSAQALGRSAQALGRSAQALGSFALFDLSDQGLARSTSLPLQESTFPVLHLVLHLRRVDGDPLAERAAAIVQGADVPPSREAQTLYTAIAATDVLRQQGEWTFAKIAVPAHVPVERVRFVLASRFTRSFLREVTVVAKPDAPAAQTGIVAAEAVNGEMWRVVKPVGQSGGPAIHAEKLNLDAVLASNLRAPATVTVVVKNGSAPPLPLREVELQMRERKICFAASAGGDYMLRYGDAGLAAPVYTSAQSASAVGRENHLGRANGGAAQADFARRLQLPVQPAVARLGRERINPRYAMRVAHTPYSERHPELLWVALMVSVAVLGTLAMEAMRRGGERR